MSMEALNKYWALIQAHWLVLSAVAIALCFVLMIAWYQRASNNGYDFLDTLKGENGKASQDPLIVYFFAALSAWYIVVKTLYPAAGNVGSDLTQILMIFLIYRLGKKGVESWERKAPALPSLPAQQGDNIAQQVVVPGIDPVSEVKPVGAIKTLKA